MRKLLFILLMFVTSSLYANMGAILIVPRDANVVTGIYSGSSTLSTEIAITSTDNTLDGSSYNFGGTEPFIGGYIGIQNSFYRLSISYDVNYYSDIQLQRYLLGFDFMIGDKNAFRPMVGFGVGVAESKYTINTKNIDHSNGVLAFRTGVEYTIDADQSLELLVEYSYMLDSLGSNYYDSVDFTSYNVKDQQAIMLRVGYSFEF